MAFGEHEIHEIHNMGGGPYPNFCIPDVLGNRSQYAGLRYEKLVLVKPFYRKVLDCGNTLAVAFLCWQTLRSFLTLLAVIQMLTWPTIVPKSQIEPRKTH